MSNLNAMEKRKLERAFGMSNGYVLNFSNRTMAEFFLDSVGIEIYDQKYNRASGSKANRMRAFWEKESNYTVGKLLFDIFNNWSDLSCYNDSEKPPEDCLKIAARLKESGPVPELDAIKAISDEKDFETLAKSVRESIEKNEPESGLDRLHTFLVKYFRIKCMNYGLNIDKKKPLHSLVGEYIKEIKKEGLIESEMTERILRSSISIIEAFSSVRNNQSYAHDNQVLNYNESLLIFGNITIIVRFIENLESKKPINKSNDWPGEIPF